jgi:hypothetical protein
MDRSIRIAWRVFWVGLGASAVLIAESVLSSRAPAPPVEVEAPVLAAPRPPPPSAQAAFPRT